MRSILSTIAGIIMVVILGAVVIGFIFWSRLPDVISNNLSKKLGVAVNIDSMHLGWGELGISKIEIGNPPGSILTRAFACERIDIEAPFSNFLAQQIVIDEIELRSVYLGLEFKTPTSADGNWTQIMANLKASTGQETAAAEKKSKQKKSPQAPAAPQRSLLIRSLVLTDIDVDVVYSKQGGKVQKLPRIERIELKNISSEGGFPMDQLMNSVLGEMLKSVFIKQNLKNMLDSIDNLVPPKVNQFIQPFKGLLNAIDPENLEEDSA